jgi:hypothetical protein
MEIRINDVDAKYLWNVLNLKDSPRTDNDDEQWNDDGSYYLLYDYENVVIKATFDVIDSGAEMDSNDFADWDNYRELVICTSKNILG